MTHDALKQELEEVGTTGIQKVLFDFSEILNIDLNKAYPLVFWDIDNSSFIKNFRDSTQLVTMDVFILDLFNDDEDKKITKWDELETVFDAYINLVNAKEFISIPEMTNIAKELYPPGIISVDNEVGMRYRVTLKLHC